MKGQPCFPGSQSLGQAAGQWQLGTLCAWHSSSLPAPQGPVCPKHRVTRPARHWLCPQTPDLFRAGTPGSPGRGARWAESALPHLETVPVPSLQPLAFLRKLLNPLRGLLEGPGTLQQLEDPLFGPPVLCVQAFEAPSGCLICLFRERSSICRFTSHVASQEPGLV